MVHLVVVLHILALMAGTAALSVVALIYIRYHRRGLKLYGFFLFSLMLLLAGFTVDFYGTLFSVVDHQLIANLFLLFQAMGGLMFIIIAPEFFHSLMGIPFPIALRRFFLAVDAVTLLMALIYLAQPALRWAGFALNTVLFGLILYGLILIAVHLRRIGDQGLRQALLTFLLLTALFFPLFYIDVLISNSGLLSRLAFLDNLSLPLYCLILNLLGIVFAIRHFNHPSFAREGKITDHFIHQYGITPRESEIIGQLLLARSARETADELFISPKTAENHIYSIYRKTGVRNRVQLVQLIRSNAE